MKGNSHSPSNTKTFQILSFNLNLMPQAPERRKVRGTQMVPGTQTVRETRPVPETRTWDSRQHSTTIRKPMSSAYRLLPQQQHYHPIRRRRTRRRKPPQGKALMHMQAQRTREGTPPGSDSVAGLFEPYIRQLRWQPCNGRASVCYSWFSSFSKASADSLHVRCRAFLTQMRVITTAKAAARIATMM